MILSRIAPVLLLTLIVGAEKKIELQDIEEDNLKSEKETYYEAVDQSEEDNHGPETVEYLKSGFLRYFKSANPTEEPQQQHYIQQYDVTEPEEKSAVTPAPEYGSPAAEQAMVGYLSKMPMEIYLVPQYVEPSGQVRNSHTEAHYSGHSSHRASAHSSPDTEQIHANYDYVPTTAKTYIQHYPSPVKYVPYSAQPTVAPAPISVEPFVSYEVPVAEYQTALVPPPSHRTNSQKHSTETYYPSARYTQEQVEKDQENDIESHNYYPAQTDTPYTKSQTQEIPRYYNSRTPIREEYKASNSELPHPSSLLLKAPPPHIAHIPKALPIHRPWNKPVYDSRGFGAGSFAPKPIEPFRPPVKRRPTSLLDSYIPSSVQIEYLKRGIIKDPLVAYEALSNARHFAHPPPSPRHFEGGFLPNQVFHTPEGGSFYGHYKRSPKLERGIRV